MDKELVTSKGFIEYTFKVRIEDHAEGYVVKLITADGGTKEFEYYQGSLLDAQESAAYMLKTEAEKLLKMLQEVNS